VSGPFANLPKGHFGAIYADPPWAYKTYSGDAIPARASRNGLAQAHYQTMPISDICALPVADIAAPDCALFVWVTWPTLLDAVALIEAWGFTYKTCAFAWTKGDARQAEFFRDDITPYMGLGYWTRANSEVCLLATRGRPKRLNADVRQAIVEPRREHSRKPDCVPSRIERLVAGPYLELFARTQRPGWTVWGNQTDKFEAAA
jgi:N6-adenosine-specific RNA methylase IME4